MLISLLASMSLGVAPGSAAHAGGPLTAADCSAVASQAIAERLGDERDAPTTVLAATVQPAAADLPEFCRVSGFVAPQVRFELRLPTSGWNGRFLMQGCGGMCGILNMEACEDALIRGYAVVNTDMGHEGDAGTTSWATNAYAPKVDFGYRATHVVAMAAKRLIRLYYGEGPSRSYFRGCSTGGRQAMVEAERFPEDFDGIVAGAPPLDESGDGLLHLIWNARASVDASGQQLIDPDKIPMLHRAALAACGGTRDGFLIEPRLCHWDPSAIECRVDRPAGASSAECLPGMAHCRRGPGADAIDTLTAIEDWVERGRAPDYLTAYHLRQPQSYMGLPVLRYPLAPSAIAWSRRIYPYPAMSVYRGTGDVNAASNWIAAPWAAQPAD